MFLRFSAVSLLYPDMYMLHGRSLSIEMPSSGAAAYRVRLGSLHLIAAPLRVLKDPTGTSLWIVSDSSPEDSKWRAIFSGAVVADSGGRRDVVAAGLSREAQCFIFVAPALKATSVKIVGCPASKETFRGIMTALVGPLR